MFPAADNEDVKHNTNAGNKQQRNSETNNNGNSGLNDRTDHKTAGTHSSAADDAASAQKQPKQILTVSIQQKPDSEPDTNGASKAPEQKEAEQKSLKSIPETSKTILHNFKVERYYRAWN